MKKLIALVLGMVFAFTLAYAAPAQFDKKNLEFGLEYNYADKDLQDIDLLSVNIPGVLDGNLVIVGDKFHLDQELATVGYKLGDLLTPYVILGASQLDANIHLNGDLTTGGWSGSATLLEIPYNKGNSAFTYGLGAKGNLLELPAQVILGYDVRVTAFNNESDNNVIVLPGIWGDELSSKTEINYLEWNALLSASREFKLAKKDGTELKYFKSLTPMIGFKFTRADIDAKTTVSIDDITASSQQNMHDNLYSGVVGLGCKVTENIDVKATGSFGDDKGFNLAATYRF